MRCMKCKMDKMLSQFPSRYGNSNTVYSTCRACVIKYKINIPTNIKPRKKIEIDKFLAEESRDFLLKLDITIRGAN